jgi:hypothetical protein
LHLTKVALAFLIIGANIVVLNLFSSRFKCIAYLCKDNSF